MADHFLRKLRIGLWGFVLLAGGAMTWAVMKPPEAPPATITQLPTAQLGKGSYHLTSTDGTAFSEASLKGQPSLVFFGFTHCPDVCPMTMAAIDGWRSELGPLADPLKVYLITVDPERDSLQIMRDYVSWMPGIQGVVGTREETEKALTAFKIYARKVPGENGAYGVDHSAYVLVFDRNGDYAQIFSHQESHEQVVEKLRRFLQQQSKD